MAKKESLYFTHDMNARQDPKLQELLMERGLEGLGAYWCIIEQLYEQGGELPLKSIKTIAFALHCKVTLIESVVKDFNLFSNDGTHFWSEAVKRRTEARRGVAEKRKEASNKRWGVVGDNNTQNDRDADADQMQCKEDANAMQTDSKEDANADQMQTKCNAIKEKKRKENKIKENNNNSLSVSLPLSSESTEPENTGARASLADKQRFLEIFYFERNLIDPLQEVTRFCAHYDANGWMRGGNPIKDKTALAKLWKPQKEGERHKPVVVQWLREVYLKAKATDPEGAVRIMTETYGVGCDFRDNIVQVTLYISPAVKQIIERNLVFRPNWRVTYQLKQQ